MILSLDTPATAFSVGEYLKLGFNGISINLDHLVPMLLGIDPTSGDLQPLLDPRHPAVFSLIHQVLLECHKSNTPVDIRGFLLSKYPDLLNNFVLWGVHSVTVNSNDVISTKSALSHAESRHLNHQGGV
jgi:phosphoenolpyruvate synthase/pyruvate phosphate dikinase